MDLKNITPFDDFKKIMEASIPNELSNKTGFSKSLVGRAMFGILRYFKKGINLGKLEFYKRKLENEYFAGILRYCAVKKIDLTTGVDPEPNTSPGPATGTTPPDPKEIEYCKVMAIDFIDSSYKNRLTTHKSNFESHKNSLQAVLNDPTSPQADKDMAQDLIDTSDKIIQCCQEKMLINDVFLNLKALSGTTDTQIVGYLDQIKAFLEGPVAKYCSTYHGTDQEKNLLKSFTTSTDIAIKDKTTNEIVPLLDSYNYNEYDLIEEKITSGLNKSVSISQMLGDQLTSTNKQMKVNIYDYLKSCQIDDVNQINFDALQKLFASDPRYRKEASDYVNVDGIREIQYAASRIIFTIKKTPDDRGINPGEGGGVDYTVDESLKTTWEKKVQFVKSEFRNFLLVEKELDPFVLLNLTDAMRKRGDYANNPTVAGYAASTNSLGNSITLGAQKTKLGIKPRGNETLYQGLFAYNMVIGGVNCYPVFSLRNTSGNVQVYKYVGNINFQKILDDKAYEDPNFRNLALKYTTPVWSTPKSDSDVALIDLLKIRTIPAEPNYKFEGIFLTDSAYNRINSYSSSQRTLSIRLLYLFVDQNESFGNFLGAKGGANKFKVNCLNNSKVIRPINNIATIKTETSTDMIRALFGEVFEIEPSWADYYFPNVGGSVVTLSKYTTAPNINETPYQPVIGLKN